MRHVKINSITTFSCSRINLDDHVSSPVFANNLRVEPCCNLNREGGGGGRGNKTTLYFTEGFLPVMKAVYSPC